MARSRRQQAHEGSCCVAFRLVRLSCHGRNHRRLRVSPCQTAARLLEVTPLVRCFRRLCLVIIDPAGTNSHAKREATTKRGSTPERRRRVDVERRFSSAGDVRVLTGTGFADGAHTRPELVGRARTSRSDGELKTTALRSFRRISFERDLSDGDAPVAHGPPPSQDRRRHVTLTRPQTRALRDPRVHRQGGDGSGVSSTGRKVLPDPSNGISTIDASCTHAWARTDAICALPTSSQEKRCSC